MLETCIKETDIHTFLFDPNSAVKDSYSNSIMLRYYFLGDAQESAYPYNIYVFPVHTYRSLTLDDKGIYNGYNMTLCYDRNTFISTTAYESKYPENTGKFCRPIRLIGVKF